jgi:hypothetical protein
VPTFRQSIKLILKEEFMECKCNKCGMGVKGLTCSKCDSALVNDTITTDNGSKVQVAKCPEGCGMIKSPTCCGQDMVCST